MSATEYDDISNKTIAAHLNRQDATLRELDRGLAELRELLTDSVTDRKAIHAQINGMVMERARLVREGQLYQQTIEERIAAVEGRGDLADVRELLAELAAANTLQLSLHRWWTQHKVRSKLLALCALGSVPLLSQAFSIIFHHFGWT
jgi:hypothetical protein